MDRSAEVKQKLDAVRTWLDVAGHDGVLIGSQSGFAWVTAGGHNHVSVDSGAGVAAVLVTLERAALLTTYRTLGRRPPGRWRRPAWRRCPETVSTTWPRGWRTSAAVAAACRS